MAAAEKLLWGETWPIEVLILDGSLAPITGSSTIVMSIRRKSDDYFLDFADATFKNSGWTTREVQLTQVDATNSPGEYKYAWGTSAVTNEVADDLYVLRVRDSSGSAASPAYIGEIQADGDLKDIKDDLTSILADTNEMQGKLPTNNIMGSSDKDDHDTDIDAILSRVDVTISVALAALESHGDSTWSTATGFSTPADLATLQSHGDSTWATAVGFATPGDLSALQTHGDGAWATAVGFATPGDVSAAQVAIIAAGAAWVTATGFATPADLTALQSHGDGTWATATGFATPTDVTNAQVAIIAEIDANEVKIDTIISTGGAGPWSTASVAGLATSAEIAALEAHGDATWSTAVGFAVPGDAMTLTVGERAAIEAALAAVHGAGSWATATGFATPGDLSTLQSALESYGDANWATAVGFAVPGDAMGLTAAAVDSIWDELRLPGHTTPGTFGFYLDAQVSLAGGGGLTQQQVRDAMKLAPTGGAPAAGSVDEALDNIETDTAIMEPLVSANLDAAISSRSNHTANDVDTVLTAAHGSGSWQQSASSGDWSTAEREQIRDALGVDGTKTAATGGQLQDVLTDTAAIDARLPVDPADESLQQASHTATQAAIAALNDLSQADVQAAMAAQGYTSPRAVKLDNLDATVSSRSSHSAADVDSTLTGTHGVGAWTTATGFATPANLTALQSALEAYGDASWVTAVGFATPGDLAALQAHGDGVWATAVGFAIPGDAMSLTVAERNAVEATLAAAHGSGSWEGSTPTQVALAVWGEALPGAYGAGTAGFIVGTNLDVVVSTRSSHSAADVNSLLSVGHGAGSWATATGFATPADVSTSEANVLAAIAVLNDIDITDVQAAFDAQGYTSVRAALLDHLDADVSSVPSAVWAFNISGNTNKTTQAGGMLNICRKAVTNRYTLTPGASYGTFVLLEDNDITPALSQLVYDALGNGIASAALSPARRDKSTI